jgi:hypothetical protein
MRSAAAKQAPPEEVRVAGRYRIDGLIAQGGMGAVYRAFDESNGTAVALKRRTSEEPRVAKMFEREYHTLKGLAHPRIIQVYDYGVDARGAYYTMELLDGSDLRELAPVPHRRACRYLRDVASSLSLLHARRLLHRDISPRNVRVTSIDRVKLIDFGVLSSFGVPDVVVGTPPFVAPEALSGAPIDQRADLFALGALSYWLLTGKHAFPARAVDELPRVWRTAPLPPSAARAGKEGADPEPIPEALDVLVLALLSTNPLARPASAAEVIDRLTTIAGLEPDLEPLAAESYLSGGATVGRDQERSRLLSRLEAALEGTGTSIVIEADPGLGSSRLLGELAVEAQLRGATPVVVDSGRERGAYGAIHDLIGKLLEAAPEEALRAAEPHASVLSLFSRDLRARLPPSPLPAQKLAQGELRMRVQKALADWLFAVSAERPLVVALDNAQRLDDASGAVIATISYHVRDHRIMLAAAVKPSEEATAPLVVRSLYETSARMRLAPLNKPELDQLLRGLFGEVPHLGRLSEHVYRSSAGNPQLCLDIVRELVKSGEIRHREGVWVVPRELASGTGSAVVQPHALRVARLSGPCRKLAEALSVHPGPLSIERCLAIAEHERMKDVWNVLEELTREEVLARTETRYHFVHEKLREYLLGNIDVGRRRALHRLVGDSFAAEGDGNLDAMLDAGFHLVQGGDEGRGADLLARAGLLLGYDSDEMGAAIPPLRAALDVFRKEGRSPGEIVKLLGPLCNAGWYCDRRLAAEYGDEAVAVLAEILGLSLAHRLRPYLGKYLSLYVGLAVALVRFVLGKGYGGIAGLRAMIVMYFNCVLSLAGVAATCLDAETARRFASKLEHLTALGREHAATLSYRFGVLLSQVPEDRLADTISGYRELVTRLEKTVRDLPEDSRLMMVGGATYAIGALESFRDGPRALEAANALDGIGLKLYAMVADQVRANYHACRGEVEVADFFRDRVEMHAVQAGSGWQAEVWAPASAILASIITEDVVGMKRTSEELDRLAVEIPSLRLHAEIARGASLLLGGDVKAARDHVEAVLDRVQPRAFIGWGAMCGALARASNALSDHAVAKALCEKTLAQLSPADLEFSAMYLIIDIELAIADAHLGDPESAVRRIDALIEKHRASGGPVTMASLHRTRALIALHLRDEATAAEHLGEMERWVKPTHNPGLLQQCEKLRARIAALARDVEESSGGAANDADSTVVDHLAELVGATATERRERALSLLVRRTNGEGGYLFDVRGAELGVVAPVQGGAPPEHVVDQVRRDVRAFRRNRRRATTELDPTELTMLTLGVTSTQHVPKQQYRTVILAAADQRVVAAAAILGGRAHALSESFVHAVAMALVEGDAESDVATSVGVDVTSHEVSSAGG